MAKKEKVQENGPDVCMSCENWKVFREKCWFFWEEKKECANHSEGFKSLKEDFDIDSFYY